MFKADGRSFTTPEAYAPPGHIIIAENKPIFAVNKVLSVREWLPLTGNALPFSLTPGNIIALIHDFRINQISHHPKCHNLYIGYTHIIH